MRLLVNLLGFQLDVTLGREPQESIEDDVYVDCGTTVSYPVGFYRPEIPWDTDGPVHQFDPSEEDENT